MICTEYDQWLKDQDKTIWMVELEWLRGDETYTTVYQDDGRPNTNGIAFSRLREVLRTRGGCRVNRFGLGFRDHIEWLPIENPDGIYFSKGAIGDMFSPHTSNCYVLGWIKDSVLTKVWYRIPEVIEYQREVLTEFDRESPSIIWHK